MWKWWKIFFHSPIVDSQKFVGEQNDELFDLNTNKVESNINSLENMYNQITDTPTIPEYQPEIKTR